MDEIKIPKRYAHQPNLYRVVEELCKCQNPKKMAYRLMEVLEAGALDGTLTLSGLKDAAEKEERK